MSKPINLHFSLSTCFQLGSSEEHSMSPNEGGLGEQGAFTTGFLEKPQDEGKFCFIFFTLTPPGSFFPSVKVVFRKFSSYTASLCQYGTRTSFPATWPVCNVYICHQVGGLLPLLWLSNCQGLCYWAIPVGKLCLYSPQFAIGMDTTTIPNNIIKTI